MNLLEKYKKSIGISFLLTILAIPIAFLELRLLNSVSPTAVAYLAIIEMIFLLFVSIISGNATLTFSKFYSNWNNQEKKVYTIYKFIIVNIIYIILFSIIIYLLNESIITFEFTPNLISIFILGEMLIIYSFLNGIVSGSLDLKAAVISIKSYPMLRYLILASFLIPLGFSFDFNLLVLVVILGLLILNIYLGIRVKKLKIFKRIKNDEKLYNQRLFLFFSIISVGRAIVLFVYEKLDQMMLLKYVDLETLSLYFVLLKIAIVIKMIPKIINTSSIPVFSSLIQNKEFKDLNKVLIKNISFNFYIGLVTILLIVISYPLLFDFLKIDKSFLPILLIIMFTYQISVTSIIYDSLLNSLGKAYTLLWNSIITIVIQFFLIFFLIETYGILGVAIAKLISGIIGQYFLFYFASKSSGIHMSGTRRIYFLIILVIYFLITILLSNYYITLFVSLLFMSLIIWKLRSERK